MKNQYYILYELLQYCKSKKICSHITNDILYVHHSFAAISTEKNNQLALSFEVNCSPILAANITKFIIDFANKNKYSVIIYECYALVADSNGYVQEVLFGDDADYYFETGELPIKKSVIRKKIDPEKKFNNLLDKISHKGIESLNKNQKQFMIKFSKGEFNINNK